MEFSPSYNPSEHESKIYSLWEKGDVFKTVPPREGQEYFSMVTPPPNANANLHIGFGLTMAIEDIVVRFNRLKGRAVLFVPGADHAGFETQSVFEKQLEKEGKSRFDFSREQLYKMIFDFVEENRSSFQTQFRQLGASVNWDTYTFTLDKKVVDQAYKTFKQMWDEGLIYRGERLVNYCTFHGTAFADIEVEYRQAKGHLWYIKYPLTDDSGAITVATTRPETMFGDVAVAVNPKDKRYEHLVGRTVKLPLTERDIPIVADETVEMEFGTGAVKITPAHDQNDFELGQRHQLPMITVINTDGTLNHEAPEILRGLKVSQGRAQTVKLLEEQGYLEKTVPYAHSVGHCYKCGTVIEPLLREQWFVDMQPLAKRALEALEAGEIKFYPQSKRSQLIRYLNGLRDWNISRQIAWGIPIPAFRSMVDPGKWIFDSRVDQEIIEVEGQKYERDPDVFDTWFSSSSWPYVTLDYPAGSNFKNFYPLSLMETGGEILYQWVARMIMMGLYTTGKVPFKEVYIHGYVMAEDGSKISKSLGNAPNTSEILDKYGSDGLRMGIVSGRVPGVNRPYDHRRIEEARNLTNKLWNVARFAKEQASTAGLVEPKSPADHWILRRTKEAVSAITQDMEGYKLAEAYEKLYHFIWDDFADWYIEASKSAPNPGVLAGTLETTLKVAHPLAPFVTEAIWQNLGWRPSTILALQGWPEPIDGDGKIAKKFEAVKEVVTEIRRIKAELGVKRPDILLSNAVDESIAALVKRLAGVGEIKSGRVGQGLKLNSDPSFCVDITPEQLAQYQHQLEAKLTNLAGSIEHLQKRLSNKAYLSKAPKSLVEQTKTELEHLKNLTSQVKAGLSAINR